MDQNSCWFWDTFPRTKTIQSFFWIKDFSMTTLLTHTVATSPRHSFSPKTNNHSIKKSIISPQWKKIIEISNFILVILCLIYSFKYVLCFLFCSCKQFISEKSISFSFLSRKFCQIVRFAVFSKFLIETIAPDFSKRLYIGELHFSTENWEECSKRENQIQNKNEHLWKMVKK